MVQSHLRLTQLLRLRELIIEYWAVRAFRLVIGATIMTTMEEIVLQVLHAIAIQVGHG